MPISQADALETLTQQLKQRLPEQEAARLMRFADVYYQGASDDLWQRKPDEIYGATLSSWHLLQAYQAPHAKVRIYNPDIEEQGWHSNHTVIEIAHPDMPFLVDSVRMALNRAAFTVHHIHSAVLALQKQNNELQITSCQHLNENTLDNQCISLLYIEIDRHTQKTTLKKIRDDLLQVFQEIQAAVQDFTGMQTQVQSLAQNLRSNPPPQIDAPAVQEAATFLDWLCDGHFTFLGLEAYIFAEDECGHQRLRPQIGSKLGVLKLDDPRYSEQSRQELALDERQFVLIPELLSFAKAPHHSRVHRPAYPDYIRLKTFNTQGQLTGEWRLLGLYTASVYTQSPRNIPILRQKVDAVLRAAQLAPQGHKGKHLLQILEVYPRDDLFQTSMQELTQTALGILNIRERRQIRVFIRRDHFGHLYSVLVFMPRDLYSTELRLKTQAILCDALQAEFVEFNTYFSESILARTQYILRMLPDQTALEWDAQQIENRIQQAAQSWQDDLYDALLEHFGEEEANQHVRKYGQAFPASYREDFNARTGVRDILHCESLAQQALAMSFYRQVETGTQAFYFKLFHRHRALPLSDILPVLENLGLRVLGEHPYQLECRTGDVYWIHDFELAYPQGEIDLHSIRDTFQEAFARVWQGEAENDTFNRLVLGAHLDWRSVAMLRAYARYMKQIRFGFSQDYIASTLGNHPKLCRWLVALFMQRFDPNGNQSEAETKHTLERIQKALDKVASLNEDRILRRYLELIQATLRTNFFQRTAQGEPKTYISFKLDPRQLADLPLPRPRYEIFVYSASMEGVHLRGGAVARGGLRWSDRLEDYRTEILGLVKAQQVKNAIIVPAGAKGGFVCKQIPENADRETQQALGIQAYTCFIQGLLDITDNLVQQQIQPPPDLVRHDEDDPYLVVAADKGTATFSDIANRIASGYDFWLGDAFASGGAHGYDHKKMGITARGAWVSVQAHFRTLGLNTQTQSFTVVGIGDMSGDVFGNGMLLSEHIRLIGAFNHKHIFIDPDPDPSTSFSQRQALFQKPQSSWDDYDKNLISTGGGIFSREAKSIPISTPMKACLGIEADKLTPNELISALLSAPVDLLWNGGIGTYVKADQETHAQVGDKTNDALRISASALRCKVIGEGGNLGLTQAARIQAAQQGVLVNTDFIDNAGGVNCSDHEVNIKILLDDVVRQGDLTLKQRNELLESMTDEVAMLVLLDNYRQTQAIGLAQHTSAEDLSALRNFMRDLVQRGVLNPELEGLPTDKALAERQAQGQGLSLPEVCVLISYAKIDLKEAIKATELADEPWIQREIYQVFPLVLVERYGDALQQHPLHKEILAMRLANDLIDHMGISFVHRLRHAGDMSVEAIVRGYLVARDIFDLPRLWQAIESLDNQVSAQVQASMMRELMRTLRYATRWLSQHALAHTSMEEVTGHFTSKIEQLSEQIGDLVQGYAQAQWQERTQKLLAEKVPEAIASLVAASSIRYAFLEIIRTEQQTGAKLQQVAMTYFALGEFLGLSNLRQQVARLPVHTPWEALLRETLRDDLDTQQGLLSAQVLQMEDTGRSLEERLQLWSQGHGQHWQSWQALMQEACQQEQADYPLLTLVIRRLASFAQQKPET
ncbi:glutamate dehydrogenase [Allopseudospirillum japonicum]|uniref:Glutamate dehydrogenase n=1 Tax=Allopseudospirillum japonicum TaxID=64971 RepID=A0A1H6T6A8_9GAMM|nr:NAD-glutamate dehydrogenase [Allopseudospirillum japonicum]SEI72667.1 glutamate dehydrogenase [Allopseudospirillum japonicum]